MRRPRGLRWTVGSERDHIGPNLRRTSSRARRNCSPRSQRPVGPPSRSTTSPPLCDNTHSAAMSETGQQIKVRHSRYSRLKLTDAREALAMVH
ncbi:MAG: DUF932 domain-containing protein, partial [Solirubrobacteraceae bacterium]